MEAVEMQRESERTCAGCRRTAGRDALLRFAWDPARARLCPDPKHKLGGRGVSVHPDRVCLDEAARRGFARALKRSVDVDVEELAGAASRLYERRVEGLLLAARRAGPLVTGTTAVWDALRAPGPAGLVLFAHDAAGHREELAREASARGWEVASFGDRASLGRLMGRAELAVVAIRDARIASAIGLALTRAARLTQGGGSHAAPRQAHTSEPRAPKPSEDA
jgi:predicted RNA-binding protein YlxR (DUF448 family)